MKSIIQFSIYIIIKILSFILIHLPESIALKIGNLAGKFTYFFDFKHRKIALKNLDIAFGKEKSLKEKKEIAKKNFENLGMNTIEFLRLPCISEDDIKKKIKIEGMSHLNNIKRKGIGALILLGHIGNWELMAFLSRLFGISVLTVWKPLKNNRWLDNFIVDIRKRSGIMLLPNKKVASAIIKGLKEKKFVALLVDQRTKRSEGIWVPFFGYKVPTTPALAFFAMKSGVPILPIYIIRKNKGKHHLYIKEPFYFNDSGDKDKDIYLTTFKMNQTLESIIREYPDQWFWVHNRFKWKIPQDKDVPS
ncbi:MAG: hypothetical protein DRG20_04035 [Deltaproteobacteria bacterium]|nr:lysophospholipid acyltransferase family protein [Deltaproteobacteria bacterium]RLA89889.1 MAG: hypothetical protein DRG20_04035 [Deltaproteobacteria bacterium]